MGNSRFDDIAGKVVGGAAVFLNATAPPPAAADLAESNEFLAPLVGAHVNAAEAVAQFGEARAQRDESVSEQVAEPEYADHSPPEDVELSEDTTTVEEASDAAESIDDSSSDASGGLL